MSLREIDYLCPNLPLFLIFFLKRGLGEMMLADASVLDVIAGKRVIGISSLAISVSSSGLMLLLEKLIFNKHWVHPVLYGPDLQFLPFSGHGHFGASATLSWVLVGKFGVKKVLLDIKSMKKKQTSIKSLQQYDWTRTSIDRIIHYIRTKEIPKGYQCTTKQQIRGKVWRRLHHCKGQTHIPTSWFRGSAQQQ